MKKSINIMTAIVLTASALLPANPASAETRRGLASFYDSGRIRGHFACSANISSLKKVPVLGSLSVLGRNIAGSRYQATVFVKKLNRNAPLSSLRQATVSYSVKVDEKPRISHQEYGIQDMQAQNFSKSRIFRVFPLEKKAVLTGSGERFSETGLIRFTSESTSYGENDYLFAAIKVNCPTPQDQEDFEGQTQSDAETVVKDLTLILKALGLRGSRGLKPATP